MGFLEEKQDALNDQDRIANYIDIVENGYEIEFYQTSIAQRFPTFRVTISDSKSKIQEEFKCHSNTYLWTRFIKHNINVEHYGQHPIHFKITLVKKLKNVKI